MPPLPVISGDDFMDAMRKIGWTTVRQKGSHRCMTKPGEIATLSIPDDRELAPGTLKKLLRDAGVTVEDLLRLLSQ